MFFINLFVFNKYIIKYEYRLKKFFYEMNIEFLLIFI